jgi:protein-S-isoprenylcysteine O-methyltransferase Ste14
VKARTGLRFFWRGKIARLAPLLRQGFSFNSDCRTKSESLLPAAVDRFVNCLGDALRVRYNLVPVFSRICFIEVRWRMRKKRVVIPKLLFIPVICVALVSHHIWNEEGLINLSLEVSAFTLVAIAAVGRIWVSAFMAGRKNQELVVDGPYSIVRNPLYLFSLLGFVGGGLAFEQFTFGALFGLLFLATHLPAIFGEERFLREKFGKPFENYMRSVPRLLPRSLNFSCPKECVFNPSVYSRAVVDSSLIMSMFLLAHVIEWGHLHHVLPVYLCLP